MNLAVTESHDKVWYFTFAKRDNSPFPLNNVTLKFTVCDVDGNVLITKSSDNNGEIDPILVGDANRATLTLIPTDTTGLGGTTPKFSFNLTTLSGQKYHIECGYLYIDARCCNA